MLKKTREEKFLNLMKLIDPLVIGFVWWLCYLLRFRWMEGESGLEGLFTASGFLLSFLTLYMYSRAGLYKPNRWQALSGQIFDVIRAHTLTIIVFIVILYFTFDRRLSRATILVYFFAALATQVFLRISLHTRLVNLRTRGKDPLRIFLAGHSASLEELIAEWRSHKKYGVEFVGWSQDQGAASKLQIPAFNGALAMAAKVIQPDLFVVADSRANPGFVESFLKATHNDVIPIHILPDVPYSVLGLNMDTLKGHLVLKFNQPDFPAVDLLLKRMMDIAGALFGLTILSPLLLILAIGVKLSSPGPIFFGQERVGMNGRRFKMWKFRSMRVTAEQQATWTTANDPRKTRFGSFIRATSLDELPQLWNILTGEMSMVGPRPEQPRYVETFRSEIPAYMLRHKMKAGLTGWAQVNGWRGDTDLHQRIECDLYYIRHWSLWFDIKIIFLTFFKGFINKNAY